ncbi:teicoplanin resistance protein VanZ [Paenibacillus flagellatus]|uniref:Teicoplanin resistance protein VanZ n=1 Tax=Paenibacillus flagellatus TaxID=2211139 RepID=A0A2V5K0A8_9BACL|nr:VanZ family protein [Paenibacillus flagellatus]PYI52635.1 teicoplanin resistance protein VanZ [Paenibacillus flagellatus]
MLTSYLFPISYAFLLFPVAALLFTLPFLIVQYRRHGYIHKLRGALLYLFLLYLMNALFLVLLPLPASRHNAPPAAAAWVQWVPLRFVLDIARETGVVADRPSTYWHLLKERAFLQAVFNIFLTVPFGMFLRYYFRAGWRACLLASLGLSLFFEVTQVTGLYGYYDYPYRLFDIDDLLLNTTGGLLGFVAAEWLSSRLPRMDKLDDHLDLTGKRVSYTRRGVALTLDWMLLYPFLALFGAFRSPVAYLIAVFLYFIVLPYATNGRTFGKWVVRIRIAGSAPRLRLREIVLRNGPLYLLLGGLHALYISETFRQFPKIVIAFYAIGLFAVDVWVCLHLLTRLFSRSKKPFHDAIGGTTHIIT